MKYVMIGLMLMLGYAGTARAQEEAVTCHIQHTLYHGDDIVDGSYQLHMFNGDGLLNVNGVMSFDGQKKNINRRVIFRYVDGGKGLYRLTATAVKKLMTENITDAELSRHYPDFFMKPGETLHLAVMHFTKEVYAVSYISEPLFLCNASLAVE